MTSELGRRGRPDPSEPPERTTWRARYSAADGQNPLLARRGTEGVVGRASDITDELVRARIDVIVVATGMLAKEMMRATHTVPIVVAASDGPVAIGVAKSLSHQTTQVDVPRQQL